MSYTLLIGDRAYSSWSLRGWLVFDAFDLPVTIERARLYDSDLQERLARFAPARTVPALCLPNGPCIGESLAIAEEIATRHPEAGHWPVDPDARAVARMLAAEMHAGFAALRSHCAMNLRVAYSDCAPPADVRDDLRRIETLWDWARRETGQNGPWLCGRYSLADVFFAPVAARIAGHSLDVGPEAAAYVAAHLAHPSFRRWRALALVDGPDQPFYRREWTRKPWPGPPPLPAQGVEATPEEAENRTCPYSGRPVTHFLRAGGRIFGFCNAGCRDKTVADPMAWPAFARLYEA